MIQRIQTVYLLIVTGLLITAMCLPMGYFTDTMGEHSFKALGTKRCLRVYMGLILHLIA